MIPLFKVGMNKDAGCDVDRILQSGFIGQGPMVEKFEKQLAEIVGNPNVVSVNSCTSGLYLSLYMQGFPAGTKMLTSPLTCTATNWAGVLNNLEPEWVDIDPETLNICLHDVRRNLREDTRVLMLVHWGGYPIKMDEVLSIKKEYKSKFGNDLFVIEDCAHAWGTTYQSKRMGNHGNVAVYSFGPIKTLSCGDGGAIFFPDGLSTERARRLRWFGIDRQNRESDIPEIGFKFHMNDINAAIGLSNLVIAERNAKLQNRNSILYDQELKGIKGLKTLSRSDCHHTSSWIYSILVENRNEFIGKMKDAGIEVGIVHRRNDKYSCMKMFEKELPKLDKVYDQMVCIPCGWWLDDISRSYIVSKIKDGW